MTELAIQDAQQIFDIRIELEPLAFFLTGPNARARQISELREMAEKSKVASRAENLAAFYENHLAFRKRIWALSGNRYLLQTLERIVIPLYVLYMIRQSYNLEGIIQTTLDCTDHQDGVLAAYEQKNFEEAREIARSFLIRMENIWALVSRQDLLCKSSFSSQRFFG